MMSYTIIANENEGFDIQDRASFVIIELKNNDEKQVRTICKKLNLGAGFGNWVPDFFMKSISYK